METGGSHVGNESQFGHQYETPTKNSPSSKVSAMNQIFGVKKDDIQRGSPLRIGQTDIINREQNNNSPEPKATAGELSPRVHDKDKKLSTVIDFVDKR